MEQAVKRVWLCVLLVVCIAVTLGIIYYYSNSRDETLQKEGTLISAVQMDRGKTWE